jgi:hypothetical protein
MNSRTSIALATAFLLGSAAAHAGSVRLTVADNLKKDRNSDKNETKTSSTRIQTEFQYYELEITLTNTGPQKDTFDLEWYFFKRPLNAKGDKGDPVLCEKKKTTLPVDAMKRVTHKVVSDNLTNRETKIAKSSTGSGRGRNNNNSSSSKTTASGEVYAGYVVLVRQAGEILAKESNDKKFLTESWLGKLGSPVKKPATKQPAKPSSKKKKPSNNKKKK